MIYDDIYALKPKREELKRGGPGWWSLTWRPLWRKTYSVYWSKYHRGFGFRWYECGAHNGWGRYYDGFTIELFTPVGMLAGWIKWNYMVMAEGPSDVPDNKRRPLTLPTVAAKERRTSPCDHAGFGLPGCRACDPLYKHSQEDK